MDLGRLIRTSKFLGAPNSIAYIVALPDPADAIELIRTKAADPEDEVEDMGRVSDDLLKELKLSFGDFMPLTSLQPRAY
jgi:hypothetical protein